MENGEIKVTGTGQSRQFDFRLPVAEHIAKGLLARHTDKQDMAGVPLDDSGSIEAIRMDSQAGNKVNAILAKIDEAMLEGRRKVSLTLTEEEVRDARAGFERMQRLGPAMGKRYSLLEEEALQVVHDSKAKDFVKSLLGRFTGLFIRGI